MQRFFTKYNINVFQLVLDEWLYPLHTHNFYELVLINKGRGQHVLNDFCVDYQQGDVFLLTPEDYHKFIVKSQTKFTYVKFTEYFFLDQQDFNKKNTWIGVIENIFDKPNIVPKCVIKDEKDRKKIFLLVKILLKEFHSTKKFSKNIMLELLATILFVVARNIEYQNILIPKVHQLEKDKINKVLSYIRKNIYDKKVLTQKHLAATFLLSPNYMSRYLKKHTGKGLKVTIVETRILVAEEMLKKSAFTISQIADKIGFNDASHMNKTFKKYRGKNPTDYRV